MTHSHNIPLALGLRAMAGRDPIRWQTAATIAWVVGVTAALGMLSQRATAASPASITPLSQQLLADAGDGTLDDFTFLDASLIASGIDQPQRLEECRRRFQELCDRLQARQAPIETRRDLAVAVLAFLHQEVLTQNYQIETTQVDQALMTGHYNCVASTILFRCLSAEMGEVPVVVATPSHVFCRYPGPARIDVETTCPDWFTLSASSAVVADHPASQASGAARTLSEVEVLGKLFYNRATDRLDSQDYSTACRLLRTALALDPADAAARENLLASINNWALQRCEAGDFTHAVQLLAQGTEISADYRPIQMNDLHVHQKWTLDLCGRQKFAAALALLEASYQRRPDVPLFDQGRFAVYGLWADSLFAQGKDTEALQLFDRAIRQHPGRPEIRQRETLALLGAVRERMQHGQHDQARSLLDRGLKRQPDSTQLKETWHDLTKLKS